MRNHNWETLPGAATLTRVPVPCIWSCVPPKPKDGSGRSAGIEEGKGEDNTGRSPPSRPEDALGIHLWRNEGHERRRAGTGDRGRAARKWRAPLPVTGGGRVKGVDSLSVNGAAALPLDAAHAPGSPPHVSIPSARDTSAKAGGRARPVPPGARAAQPRARATCQAARRGGLSFSVETPPPDNPGRLNGETGLRRDTAAAAPSMGGGAAAAGTMSVRRSREKPGLALQL